MSKSTYGKTLKVFFFFILAILFVSCAGVRDTENLQFDMNGDLTNGTNSIIESEHILEKSASVPSMDLSKLPSVEESIGKTFSKEDVEQRIFDISGQKVDIVISENAIDQEKSADPCRPGASAEEATLCGTLLGDNQILLRVMSENNKSLCSQIKTESLRDFCLEI